MEKKTRGYVAAIVVCALLGALMPVMVSADKYAGYALDWWDVARWSLVSGGLAFAVTYGVHWRRRLLDSRAEKQWQAVEDEVVRTEKVEQLGHTLGGLSEATDARAGQLSETADP